MKLNDYTTRPRVKQAIFIIIFLLFITLLRNPPPQAGGFIPASFISLIEGHPLRLSQGGLIDSKVRGALSNATGGPAGPNAGRPVILPIDTLVKGGGSAANTARPPLLYGWIDTLIERIQQVESGSQKGEVKSEKIKDGDDGRAVGALQMHKGAVDDVNRYYKTNFSYSDRSDFPKARLMAALYIRMWMEKHREEIAARIFNGGPRGWQKKSTDEYWEKIRETRERSL